MEVIWTMKDYVVTKVGIELLGQLKRDRMVLLLFPLTDKIFGKTEVTDNGVAPPHPTTPLGNLSFTF